MKYFFLFLSAAFNVISYILYKSISNRQTDFFWMVIFVTGLVLGIVNVFFFTKALKNIPMSIAYPVFSGGCIFFLMLLSHTFFGEKITTVNFIGAAVVVVGIALMTH